MTARLDRDTALARLAAETFDIVVVGGGITGAGVALDAAARGLRTALVERHDLASGTSSRSSKLVHGGLRYLQQREFRLVRENLAERQRLLRNAPHLVRPLPFLVPLFRRGGTGDRAMATAYTTALWAYDLAGGLRIGHRHRRVPAAEVLVHLPALRPDRITGGFLYYDARADDARLTLAVARTAALDHGVAVATYAPVAGVRKDGYGRAVGVILVDGTEVRASAVVNATGVWTDHLRALDDDPAPAALRPAKGTHVTVSRGRMRWDMAAVLPVVADHRSVFVVPWADRVYIGTTDTEHTGPLDDPVCTPDDVAYLLDAVNAVLVEPLGPDDVVATWAGLRPLLGDAASARTADLSRRHQVAVSPSGMVTVTGGKLTTYRKMAADAVDQVVARLGRGASRSPTRRLALRGAAGTAELRTAGAAGRLGVEPSLLAHLVDRHGGEAPDVLRMIRADADLARPLVPGLPYIRAEAVWAVRQELAHTLDDVLTRRTRARLLDAPASAAAADDVARLLAPEMGWDPDRAAREASSYRAAVHAERGAAGLGAVAAGS